MSEASRFWGIVPAAGVGRRMGADTPKQYLKVRGKPVLQHTVERLLAVPRLQGLVVALGSEDPFWAELDCASDPRVRTCDGGRERADSVLAALTFLSREAAPDDWVLVHDAARLCITVSDVDRLIDAVRHHPTGGILALPSSDTLKSVQDRTITETLDRNRVWRALTPQMFRLGALREALDAAARQGLTVTDEASALELQGSFPLVVEGRPDNIKITRPEDLPLAAFYLEAQCCE
ncbi:2-C-methyl-D-erythritol 4-phosphate cytidylyltransferase [Methylotetracoccus oryzae]|uniref:2-C-methyl-D-erythritol 4-phosphate cytidylyltransferase n=1 Tax=Methylotetracoccus oryzae TaxID=1919059 RepID=UPI00111A8A77|nr:2-C-methyl-D-erythritol 4-phosphate cytidylyltransferase [Methylotetracoccus oryzae]